VRLIDAGWGIDGASDHGTHEAIYLHDVDYNGIELAWDRANEEWPRKENGEFIFSRKPLDFPGLIGELGDPDRVRHLEYLAQYD